MIPKNINKKDILRAIEHVDRKGVPTHRQSRKLYLIYDGRRYPPKYIVGLANKFRNGQELDSNDFNSGNETINFLRKWPDVFKVVDTTDANR